MALFRECNLFVTNIYAHQTGDADIWQSGGGAFFGIDVTGSVDEGGSCGGDLLGAWFQSGGGDFFGIDGTGSVDEGGRCGGDLFGHCGGIMAKSGGGAFFGIDATGSVDGKIPTQLGGRRKLWRFPEKAVAVLSSGNCGGSGLAKTRA